MNITITNDAMNYIKDRMPDAKDYLVTVDDGSNNFSQGKGGSCTVGDSFQVVGVSSVPKEYDIKLDNNQDAKIYTDKNDTTYFGPGLKLDFAGNFLQLKDDGEMLDGQVTTNNQVNK